MYSFVWKMHLMSFLPQIQGAVVSNLPPIQSVHKNAVLLRTANSTSLILAFFMPGTTMCTVAVPDMKKYSIVPYLQRENFTNISFLFSKTNSCFGVWSVMDRVSFLIELQ